MTGGKTLVDVCELIVDCEHKTAPVSDTGYPSIRTPNVGRGRLILEGVNRVDAATYRAWTKRAIPRPGDLIIAREAPIGNVALITRGQEVCLGQRTVLVRPDRRHVDERYLTYLLLGHEVQEAFRSASIGATVPHLNMRDIRELSLPELPPLEQQGRIGEFLSTFDDLIENNTRRIAILEEMARRIFEEWFVHFRAPGCDGVPLVDSPIGPVPEGWAIQPLADLANVNPEQLRPKAAPDEINYIDIASVSPGNIEQINRMSFIEAPGRARRIVKHGDIIWSCVRPNRRSFAIILTPPLNTIASTGFAVLRAERVPWSYLYPATTTQSFTDYLSNRTTGAAYPAVKAEDFENALIVVPPEDLLSAYEQQAKRMWLLANNLRNQNRNLRAQRDLLLPKLISGEIDVSAAAAPLREAAE